MITKTFIKSPKMSSPWCFFLATFIWTWVFWGIAYFWGVSAESGSPIGVGLILGGICGPAIVGITLVIFTMNKEGQKDFLSRAFSFRRIPIGGLGIALFLIPMISLFLAHLNDHLTSMMLNVHLPHIGLILISALVISLLEELGWRGFVLDRLQERFSPLVSSLILGLFWWGWHLPLFFLPDSVFKLMPVGSLVFWLYFVNTLTMSILLGWVYNHTQRSILGAILMHASLNFSAHLGLIPWDSPKHLYHVIVWILIVLGLFIIPHIKALLLRPAHPSP